MTGHCFDSSNLLRLLLQYLSIRYYLASLYLKYALTLNLPNTITNRISRLICGLCQRDDLKFLNLTHRVAVTRDRSTRLATRLFFHLRHDLSSDLVFLLLLQHNIKRTHLLLIYLLFLA